MTVVPSAALCERADDGDSRLFDWAELCLAARYAPSVPLDAFASSMDFRDVASGPTAARLRVRKDLGSDFGIEQRVEL
jgi:hypothetical protein